MAAAAASAAEYPGSFLHECRDISKRVSLTEEADWDYWTFSGRRLMEVELDFNEVPFALTGVVYLFVWRARSSKGDVEMVLEAAR